MRVNRLCACKHNTHTIGKSRVRGSVCEYKRGNDDNTTSNGRGVCGREKETAIEQAGKKIAGERRDFLGEVRTHALKR